jgi:hypothetical protein
MAQQENNRLEFLLDSREMQIAELQGQVDDLSGGSNGIAVVSLIRIVSGKASTRQKLKACSIVLGYRVDPEIGERIKRYLETLCERGDVPLDYRLQAAELLRKASDVKISPAVARPDYTPPRYDTAEEIAERHERQKAHIEEQARLNAIELAEEQQRFASQRSRS